MTIMDKETTKKKKKKQHILLYKFISFILVIMSIASIGYIFYEDFLPLNYILYGAGGLFVICYLNAFITVKTKLRLWAKNIFAIISVLIIIGEALVLFFGSKTFDFLESITDKGSRVSEYGIYVLNSSSIDKVEDLKDKEIEYIDSNDDNKLLDALNKLKSEVSVDTDTADSLELLLNDLNENKTDSIILEINYEDIIREEYEDIYNNIKRIKSYKIKSSVDVLKSDKDITKDPFVMYVSGIDTSGNIASSARSDVNLLIGVNPKTHQILLVNTPRDYYVKLHTKQKMDKLTHAGVYGVEESLKTLADLYEIDVDYYARVNFTSFVKLVDALGGVTVDVPKDFCEQNSKRSFAANDLICLKKGSRTLKGEQALAYARNRHAFNEGDRARGEHQMELVKAVINKAISPSVITKYTSLLNALDGKVSTNMENRDVTRFIKKQMKHNEGWKFTTISADGGDSYGVCYSTGSTKAYVMKPKEETVNTIKEAFQNLITGLDNIMPETTQKIN